jgi:parallel beta-helix repeat protein
MNIDLEKLNCMMPRCRCGMVSLFFATFALLAHAGDSIMVQCVVPDDANPTTSNCIPVSSVVEWIEFNAPRDGSKGFKTDVIIEFRAGVYRLRQPLVIDARIKGPGGGRLILKGAEQGRTIFSGAIPLTYSKSERMENSGKEFQVHLQEAQIDQLSDAVERRFGQSAIPDMELFFRADRMTASRWPNSGFGVVDSVTGDKQTPRFTVAGRIASSYRSERDLFVGGYFMHDWADELLRARVTSDGMAFEFVGKPPRYGIEKGRRVWLENALHDVDAVGEWQLDRTSGKILFLPPQVPREGDVELSVGRVGISISDTTGVDVEGIDFIRFRQSGIILSRAVDITINDVRVHQVGNTGIRLNGHHIRVDRVEISDIGGTGVIMNGGDRKSLEPGVIVLRNSTIERVGVLHKTYNPAVSVYGVGNEVSDCTLRDGPHAAIIFHGNDHLLRRNLIERFVTETDDAGAIYTGQDWTERGTVIEDNVIRYIGGRDRKYGANAIYLDDQASGIIVKNNVVDGVQRGIFIGGGRDNVISDNLLLNCKVGIYIDARGTVSILKKGKSANERFFKSLNKIEIDREPYASHYPNLKNLIEDEPGRAKNNTAIRNYNFQCAPLVIKEPAVGAIDFRDGLLVIHRPVHVTGATFSEIMDEYMKIKKGAVLITPDMYKVIK